MKVYTIIVTYNGLKWINKCFESLRHSSINIHTIVIDNGSKDGTQKKIKEEYPEVILIQSNDNIGFGQANNIGISYALKNGADYFFLLNQDAWVEPDTIERLCTIANIHHEFGILSPIHYNGQGNALDYNFSNYIIPSLCPNLYSDLVLKKKIKSVYQLPFVNAAAWLITKKCVEKVGGFNPSFFHYGEDVNYCQRVIFHSLKIGIVPNTNIMHDREQRKENYYFDNYEERVSRMYILKLSDPQLNENPSLYYIQFYKSLIKSLLFLRLKSFIMELYKIRNFKKLNLKEVVMNRLLSMQKGLNFLNNG